MITFAIFINAQYHMSQTLKRNLLMIHTNSNDRKVRKELIQNLVRHQQNKAKNDVEMKRRRIDQTICRNIVIDLIKFKLKISPNVCCSFKRFSQYEMWNGIVPVLFS